MITILLTIGLTLFVLTLAIPGLAVIAVNKKCTWEDIKKIYALLFVEHEDR